MARMMQITELTQHETHHEKSSEVFISVLQHVKLHFGSGRVSCSKL